MNHTLTHGLELLLVLASAPRPHTLAELTETMALPKSHVHRLLKTLIENQYVVKDEKRRYAIGLGALRLGHALLRDIPIRRAALPHMQRLAGELALPVTLALPFGHEAMSIAHVTPDGQLRRTSETLGSVLAPTTTALGKLFLAFLPTEARDEILPTLPFRSTNPRAHQSAESLRLDLEQIATRDYSHNDRETGPEQASLGVRLCSAQSETIAGLGISGSAQEISPARVSGLIDSLHHTARQIEHQLQENQA